MAESEADRTEEATPKRREEARSEGRFPRSQELTIAVSLFGTAMALGVAGPGLGATLGEIMRTGFIAAGSTTGGADATFALVREVGFKALAATVSMIVAVAGGSVLMAALQARGTFTTKTLAPKWSHLSPANNLKKVLGTQALVELAKSLLKLVIVGTAVYAAAKVMMPDAVALAQQSPVALAMFAKTYAVKMLTTAGTAYLILAGADYFWQWHSHEKQMRMSKEEVKQEYKEQDGDPHVKGRRRQIARGYARRQMMKDIPQADVVITNPTHIAIAIKYDPDVAPAPIVLAVGRLKVAERIKAIAIENGIPTVENRPVARALVKVVKPGSLIPVELYLAVAEILAYVMRTRAQRGAWAGSASA